MVRLFTFKYTFIPIKVLNPLTISFPYPHGVDSIKIHVTSVFMLDCLRFQEELTFKNGGSIMSYYVELDL